MIREVQKSLTFSVKKTLEGKIQTHNAGDYFDVQDKKITSKHHGITIFEGMANHTADSIKSLEAFDRAYAEEAHKLSQRSLDLLRPTIRKPGSELWFAWNPEKPTDPIESFFNDMPKGAVLVKANYMDNPWLSEESRKDMEYDRERDPDKYAHIWLGNYLTHSESRVFTNWRIEEFEVDKNAIKRQGADWGYAIDPSVLVQSYIEGRTLYVCYEAYMVGCEIIDTPDLFDEVPEARQWPIIADSARPETIAFMKSHGFPRIYGARKGAGSIEEGINFLQGFDIVVHPRCVHTIDEMTMYSYKTDPLTGKVLPILQDKKNNVIDALRYSHEGARKSQRKPPQVQRRIVSHEPHAWIGA